MRFVVLALLLALAYWYSVRVGMRVGSASVGTVLVGGVALRLVVSLLSTHGDLIGNTADPTTYEVGSGYLSAGWHVASSVQPPATIGKNFAMVLINALVAGLPGSPSLHTSTALVAVTASSIGIALVIGATYRGLADIERRLRQKVVFRTAVLCSILPSVLYATSQNFKEAYQVLGIGLVLDGMSRFLGPGRRVTPVRVLSGAAIVAAARPVLIVLVPMFLVVPYAARLLLGRLRSVAAAVGLVALLLVALPLAGGSTLRTQFENTASLGGGSQLSLPAGRFGSSALTLIRAVWATEPWLLVRSALGIVNWLESLAIGTMLAWAYVRVGRSAIRGRVRPFMFALATLAIVPAWLVAASTGNGGALVRYRAPFLVVALPLVAAASVARTGTVERRRRQPTVSAPARSLRTT